MSNLNALGDRVFIKRAALQAVSDGGIVIPDGAGEKGKVFARGQVVAVGPGRINERGALIPNSVEVGAHVLFDRQRNQAVKIENDELVVVFDEDIVAVIE